MNEDKAARYHRLKRRAAVVSLVWGIALLVALLATGWTVTLRAAAESAAALIHCPFCVRGPKRPGLALLRSVRHRIGLANR